MEPAKKKAIEELVRGLSSASELKEHLADYPSERMAPGARDGLVDEVISSFSNALSLVSSSSSQSLMSGATRSQGRPRRQKTRTRIREDSPAPCADGYSWRKYGQKRIQLATHPRDYFRCSYRERNCEARKQVQRIQDNPPVYRTTYFGEHTCHGPQDDIFGGYDAEYMASNKLISFDKPQDQNSCWPTSSMNQEELRQDQEQQLHSSPLHLLSSLDDSGPSTDLFEALEPILMKDLDDLGLEHIYS